MEEGKDRQRRIIVDIDNTLWNLAPELGDALMKINPQMPPPALWSGRKAIEQYLPLKEFFRVLKEIHMRQETYAPFPESEFFLASLRKRGFYIIIASHRHQETYGPTVNWLGKNRLLFDEIHLSYDKSVLFPTSLALVDDSPMNLRKAVEAGILGTGLLSPWNEDSAYPLFKTLIGVLGYLDSKLNSGRDLPE